MTKPEYIIKVGNVTVMTWEQYKIRRNRTLQRTILSIKYKLLTDI